MSAPNLSHLVSELDQCLAHWREAASTPRPSAHSPQDNDAISENTTADQKELSLSSPKAGAKNGGSSGQLENEHQKPLHQSQQSLTLSFCKDLISKLGPDLVKASLADDISQGTNASSSSDRSVGPSSTMHHGGHAEDNDQANDAASAEEHPSGVRATQNKRKRSDAHEPPGAPPASRAKYPQGSGRTMTFDEIYQNGRAAMKHRIVQFPSKTGKWYILSCEKHGVFFKNPLVEAGSHLASKLHGGQSQEPTNAIKQLGIEVLGCNRTLAEKNNNSVLRAYRNGYRHPHCEELPHEEENGRYPRRARGSADAGTGTGTSGRTRRQQRHEQGITEPIPGEVYLAYWKKSKDWSAVLILPYTNLEEVGVPGSLESLGLMDSIPECYGYDRQMDTLTWRPEYEPEGTLASQRQFPVMYFDGQEFPARSAVGWAAAEDLKLFDVESTHASLIQHYRSVREFLRDREDRNAGSPSREIQVGPRRQVQAVSEGAQDEQDNSTWSPICDDDDSGNNSVAGSGGDVLRERAAYWNPSDISDLSSSSDGEGDETVHISSSSEERFSVSDPVISNESVTEKTAEDLPMTDDSDVVPSRARTQSWCRNAPISPATKEWPLPAHTFSNSTPEKVAQFDSGSPLSRSQSPLLNTEELAPPDTGDGPEQDSAMLGGSNAEQAPRSQVEHRSTPSSEQFTPQMSRLQSTSSETSASMDDTDDALEMPNLEPRGPSGSFVASSIACLAQKVFETLHQQKNQYASHHGSSEHCGAGNVMSGPAQCSPVGTASRAYESAMAGIQPTGLRALTPTLPREARQHAAPDAPAAPTAPTAPTAPAAPRSSYSVPAPPSSFHNYAIIKPLPTQASPELQLALIQNSTMLSPNSQHSPIPMQHQPLPYHTPPTQYHQPGPSSAVYGFPPMNPASPVMPHQTRSVNRPMPLHPPLRGRLPSQPDLQITNSPSGPEYPANPLPPIFTADRDDLPPAEIPPLNWGSEVISPNSTPALMNANRLTPPAEAQSQGQGHVYNAHHHHHHHNQDACHNVSQVYHARVEVHPQNNFQAQMAFVAVPTCQAMVMARLEDGSNSDDEVFPTGLPENPMKGRRRNFKPVFVWPDDIPAALVEFCVRHLQARGLHPGPVGFASDYVSYNCHFCPDTKGWFVAGAFFRHLKKRHGLGCDKAIIF